MAIRNSLLFVDDADSRANLREIFEARYNILEAETNAQAMLLLQQFSHQLAAVLISDREQEDGSLLRQLRETGITRQIPVVAVLDWGDETREERALALGAAEVLTRPLSRAAAQKRIENVIALHHGLQTGDVSGKADVETALPEAAPVRLWKAAVLEDQNDLDLEIYRTIMDHSGDVAFAWDMESDVLRCSPKWKARFGYAPICREASANLFVISHFHPDDLGHLREKVDGFRQGLDFGEATVRIVDADGRYSWNRIRASAQRDEAGELCAIVGVIADVDTDHRASRALMKRAERDALTGLLNKDAARQQVELYLERAGSEQKAALLIVDLDDFKEVNDRYGHMFGDAVLARVASAIRGLFRDKDILARIGGDEFMVFMRDIPDGDLVERRCQMLLDTLAGLFDRPMEGTSFGGSVGFALVPDHGVSYQTLFQRADRALYQAKGNGKNSYRCYEASDSTAAYRTKVSQRIDSDAHGRINIGGYANFALERLRETDDEGGTIRLLMELIGRQMGVSRIYLYENTAEQHVCVNRFEWCAEGVTPLETVYPELQLDTDCCRFEEHFNEQEVIYASDVTEMPGKLQILSEQTGANAVLLRSIREKGLFRGYVGVDVCGEKRLWTQDEIEIMTFLSHLASLWLPRILKK